MSHLELFEHSESVTVCEGNMKNKTLRKQMVGLELNITRLAESIGYSREHVSRVLSGRVKSKRAIQLIRKALTYKSSEPPVSEI